MASWQFEFDAPAGTRVLGARSFIGVEAGWSDHDLALDEILWWDSDNRRWRADDEIAWGKGNPARDYCLSSSAYCGSFRAFKRHLRRHGHKLGGRRVRLVSRYVGHDVYATMRK